MKSNFVEYHICIIDKNYDNENYTTQGCQISGVHWVDTFSLFLPPSIWNLTHGIHHESLSHRVYKIARNLPYHESNA